MPKIATTDHGEIIHFAGFHHLFPVAKKTDPAQVRLAGDGEVAEDEARVGWHVYFRAFIDRGLVFLHDGTSGQTVTRAEAEAARAAPAAGPAGAASSQA
jgi:hypothetical protein